MDIKIKGALVSAVRRYSSRWKVKTEAKKKNRCGEALQRCELCKIYVYEGKKPLEKYLSKFPGKTPIIKEKIQADHILGCSPPEGFTTGIMITGGKRKKPYLFDWNIFLTRMFCETVEEYQFLCKSCHRLKSNNETAERVENRKKKD